MPFKFVKPDQVILGNVTQIDLQALWDRGIRGFIFDLDNTLMEPHSETFAIREDVSAWLSQLGEKGFKSFLLTNNKREAYSKQAAAVLNMPVIWYAAKPNPDKFHQALSELNLSATQVAVVGDRPLTDIWGGQRIGAHTILVEPLRKGQEPPVIQILRALERSLIRHPHTV